MEISKNTELPGEYLLMEPVRISLDSLECQERARNRGPVFAPLIRKNLKDIGIEGRCLEEGISRQLQEEVLHTTGGTPDVNRPLDNFEAMIKNARRDCKNCIRMCCTDRVENVA